jgi:ent-kaurenoic acid hydroxylase
MMIAMGSIWIIFIAIVGALLVLRALLKNVINWLLYEAKLGVKQYSLPPGDMGWPLIGNMWSFLKAFKSNDPDSFMASFVKR